MHQLDKWVVSGIDDYLAPILSCTSHVRQAAHFLVSSHKARLSLADISLMCPALNTQQLYRLCTTFWNDQPDSQADGKDVETVSGEVLEVRAWGGCTHTVPGGWGGVGGTPALHLLTLTTG